MTESQLSVFVLGFMGGMTAVIVSRVMHILFKMGQLLYRRPRLIFCWVGLHPWKSQKAMYENHDTQKTGETTIKTCPVCYKFDKESLKIPEPLKVVDEP